ncbi:YhdP family protein, partial [Kaarinaea lacus]
MTVWYGFAAATVLVAAVFSLARLLLPMMEDYSVTVEEYFTQIVNQPIKIQSLDAEWHGVTPSLVLKNVRLLDQQGKNTIVRLSKARLGFGWWETLQVGQLSFSSLDLIGVDLSLVRQENGRIGLLGFELGDNVESDVVDEAFLSNWLLGQGRIGLEIRNVFYDDRMERGRKYHFSNVELTLRNDGERHLIDGYVAVPNQPDQKMSLAIEANGNLLEYGQWSGSMYVSGNQINIIDLASSLTPMAHNFEVGASDFELWSQWQDSRLQKLQGEFVLRDVLLQKSVSTNTSAESVLAPINRYDSIGARLVWRNNANGWEFNADNVTLHRDQFEWPLAQASVSYNNDAGSGVLSGAGSFIR